MKERSVPQQHRPQIKLSLPAIIEANGNPHLGGGIIFQTMPSIKDTEQQNGHINGSKPVDLGLYTTQKPALVSKQKKHCKVPPPTQTKLMIVPK